MAVPASPGNHYKWELLGLLWFANFLNQGDRQIFNCVLPLIKVDLHVDDIHMGLVATTFTLVYGVLVPVAGWIGDRFHRKWIICVSFAVFSVGTMLTGISHGLLALVRFRSLATGGGECFYTPPAYSLLSQHHRATRGVALAINQTALYIGVVTSSWIAAAIAEQYGWRVSFFTFGAGGLILSLVMMGRLRNDAHELGHHQDDAPASIREILRVLIHKPTFFLLSGAFGCMTFATGGFVTWMPTLLIDKFHLSLSAAAFQSVCLHYLFAFCGVLTGGWLSDRIAQKRPVVRLQLGAAGLLLGAPFIYLLGAASSALVVYGALAVFGFFRGIYDATIFASLYEVVSSRHRSSATGLMIMAAMVSGASAPLFLGYIRQCGNLSMGMSWLSVAYVAGALLIWIAIQFAFDRDRKRVACEGSCA